MTNRAHRRVHPLSSCQAACCPLVQEHQYEQDRERKVAGLWEEGGCVFTEELGRPINPSTDYRFAV
jgi:hypothetical protein